MRELFAVAELGGTSCISKVVSVPKHYATESYREHGSETNALWTLEPEVVDQFHAPVSLTAMLIRQGTGWT
jgi:hypothetical protein